MNQAKESHRFKTGAFDCTVISDGTFTYTPPTFPPPTTFLFAARALLSSIEKARRVLGYEPKTDFKEGLGHTYNWFTENLDNIKHSAEF